LLAALQEKSLQKDLIVLPENSLEVALRLADYFQAEAKALLEGKIVITQNDIETILKSTIIAIYARMSFLENLIAQTPDEEWKAPFAEMVKTIEALDKLQKSLAEKHLTCAYRRGELLRSMKEQLAALPEEKRDKELADLPNDLHELLQK